MDRRAACVSSGCAPERSSSTCLQTAGSTSCRPGFAGFRSAGGLRRRSRDHGSQSRPATGRCTFSGGLLTTCGLDHVGEPTEDDISRYGYPGHEREQFGLHGRLTFAPAQLEAYGVDWEAESPCAFVQGNLRQARLLGESLTLRRRISVPLGGREITVRDEISNDGFAASPHLLLYHVNAGWPLVQAGARVAATVGTPRWCPDGATYAATSWC